jgi:hypothetical protein
MTVAAAKVRVCLQKCSRPAGLTNKLPGCTRGRQRQSINSWTTWPAAGVGRSRTGLAARCQSIACVRHLSGAIRVVVAFETAERAWVLLVGPHDNKDPILNVYSELASELIEAVPRDSGCNNQDRKLPGGRISRAEGDEGCPSHG